MKKKKNTEKTLNLNRFKRTVIDRSSKQNQRIISSTFTLYQLSLRSIIVFNRYDILEIFTKKYQRTANEKTSTTFNNFAIANKRNDQSAVQFRVNSSKSISFREKRVRKKNKQVYCECE